MEKRLEYTTTLGYMNHNPTNIRYSENNKWQGQIGSSKGFCVFNSEIMCYRATTKIIKKYIDRGENTVEKIITLWAPKSENPTEAYVRFICTKTGIKRNRPLSIYERRLIVAIIVAMTAFECRRYYPPISYVEAGYDLAVTE